MLSEAERLQTVKTVSAGHDGQKFVIAGVDERSTIETLRLSENYAEAGADFIPDADTTPTCRPRTWSRTTVT